MSQMDIGLYISDTLAAEHNVKNSCYKTAGLYRRRAQEAYQRLTPTEQTMAEQDLRDARTQRPAVKHPCIHPLTSGV